MLDKATYFKLREIYHSPSAWSILEFWSRNQSKEYILDVLVDEVHKRYIVNKPKTWTT